MDCILNEDKKLNITECTVDNTELIICSGLSAFIVTEGNGFFSVNGGCDIKVKRGSFCLFSVSDYISLKGDKSFKYLRIDFPCSYLNKNLIELLDVMSIPFTGRLSDEDFKYSGYFSKTLSKRIEREKSELSDAFNMCLLEEIILLLWGSSSKENDLPAERLNRAFLYVMENFRTEISVKTCAERIGCSDNVLRGMFARNIKITFNKYLNDIRLKYAMKLIVSTDRAITDICYDSGFNTLSFFSKLFKQKYGISPKEIRKEN